MKSLSDFITVCCLAMLLLLLGGCNDQGQEQGEGRVANPLNPEQVVQKFFEAYRDFDRAAAEKVSNPNVVNKLEWNRRFPRASNLKWEGESIHDGNRIILLEILSDGHVGASISEITIVDS